MNCLDAYLEERRFFTFILSSVNLESTLFYLSRQRPNGHIFFNISDRTYIEMFWTTLKFSFTVHFVEMDMDPAPYPDLQLRLLPRTIHLHE